MNTIPVNRTQQAQSSAARPAPCAPRSGFRLTEPTSTSQAELHASSLHRSVRSRKRRSIAAMHRDQGGLSTVEYMIIFALIAAGGIGLWQSLGSSIKEHMTKSTNTLNNGIRSGGIH